MKNKSFEMMLKELEEVVTKLEKKDKNLENKHEKAYLFITFNLLNLLYFTHNIFCTNLISILLTSQIL